METEGKTLQTEKELLLTSKSDDVVNFQSSNKDLVEQIHQPLVITLVKESLPGEETSLGSVSSYFTNNRGNDATATATALEETPCDTFPMNAAKSDTGSHSHSSTSVPSNILPNSSLKRHAVVEGGSGKKAKKNLKFNDISIYYFPREQGFDSVPSKGGCQLGMSTRHSHAETFSLDEYTGNRVAEAVGRQVFKMTAMKERRQLLTSAGVRIDVSENKKCENIRKSRKLCGCECENNCDPNNCSCSQNNIVCLVDTESYPCSCTENGCGNVNGRMEYVDPRLSKDYNAPLLNLELQGQNGNDSKDPDV